jgi:hypothetical protein
MMFLAIEVDLINRLTVTGTSHTYTHSKSIYTIGPAVSIDYTHIDTYKHSDSSKHTLYTIGPAVRYAHVEDLGYQD